MVVSQIPNDIVTDDIVDDMVHYTLVSEAIKVVESRDEEVLVGDKYERKKVIHTIRKYRSGPSLEQVLLQEEFKNLPILVFSITGKTRGGKSFLLNMMIKYLEAQNWSRLFSSVVLSNTIVVSMQFPADLHGRYENILYKCIPNTPGQDYDWNGTVPSCFAWNMGLDSVTKGIWIWPKIYKFTNSHKQEVGILLMDNEGMFDGEMTDGEIIAISGISTALSYLQMFNVKEKITTDYLESVVRNLVKGIEEMDVEQSSELRKDYKLMFLVRDWIGANTYGYGVDAGHNYIATEKQTGTDEKRMLWQEITTTFNDTQCTLLPFPGFSAMTPQFTTTGDLRLLDPLFLEELKMFIEYLFSPTNLVPPETKLTGQAIYNLLINADKKVADDSLSFVNMFTDHANFDRVVKLKASFDLKLLEIPLSELNEAKSMLTTILGVAENSLKGRSASKHLAILKREMEEKINKRIVDDIMQQYKVTFDFTSNVVEHQSVVWPDIIHKLQEFLCGDSDTLKEANEKAAQKAAGIYYSFLSKEIKSKFKTACADSTLEMLAGLNEKMVRDNFIECTDFGNTANNHNLMNPIWFRQQGILKDEMTHMYLQRIHELTKVSIEWLKSARSKQYEYFELFTLLDREESNWDTISRHKKILINKKVGFAMFGFPSRSTELLSVDRTCTENVMNHSCDLSSGYSDDQERQILPVVEKIISLSKLDLISFSCIFLTFQQDKDEVKGVPLFRVKTGEVEVQYVDTNCRVYQKWEHFLTSNILPDVVFCYPLYGSYDKRQGFSVTYAKSPSSALTWKTLKHIDRVEKWISYSAGAAGIVALTAVACGTIVPFVAPFAIVGGGLAGAYGTVRSTVKMLDKVNHDEPVTKKDYLSFAANFFAALGMGGPGVVAEGVAFVSAIGLNSINALTDYVTSEDTPNLIVLLNEIADNSLKILFYFNTSSSHQAIEVIQESLRIPASAGTESILKTLLEINSLQSVSQSRGVITMEKYVSKGVTEFVTSLLKTINHEVEDVLLLFAEITGVYQAFRSEEIKPRQMVKGITFRMSNLLRSALQENEDLKSRMTRLLSDNKDFDPDIRNNFILELHNSNSTHLLIILRYLVYSVSSRIRKANQFYNNIEHKAIRLHGYDVQCHPLKEVNQKISDLIQQDQSSIDLTSKANPELDNFVREVLKLLFENAKPFWTSHQFAPCLLKITKELVGMFDHNLERHKFLVQKKVNPTCSDLESFFQEIGMRGNYGSWLLEKVLENYTVYTDKREVDSKWQLAMLPAWSGILDRLYIYSSDRVVECKQDLIQQITRLELRNYMELPREGNNNLVGFEPSDDLLPTYIIYYTYNNSVGETGLVWFDK